MFTQVMTGLLIPLAGTALGAACVFFMKKELGGGVARVLSGFASGVMVAAGVWSLLIPAMEQSAAWGRLSFVPATLGFFAGVFFLMLLDCLFPCLRKGSGEEGAGSENAMLVLAVTLHNLPEGMAIGAAYAACLQGDVSPAAALALSVGIGIQNFPEGAIVSMPLHSDGWSRRRSFAGGVLSGVVEPIGAALTMVAAGIVLPALPYLLSFAAGAMFCVVVSELLPQVSGQGRPFPGVVAFAVGFAVMMALDVALG